MGKRRGSGEGSIWFDRATGYWKASIELGYTPDGARKRWTSKARKKARLLEKVDAARLELAQTGTVAKKARRVLPPTTGEWLTTWLYDIQKHRLTPSAFAKQRSRIERHVIPGIGDIRLDELTVDDVRKMLLAIRAAGKTPTSKAAHRALSAALNVAVAEGKVKTNVAKHVGLSRTDAHREDTLDIDEARAILAHVRTSTDVTLRDRVLTELRLFTGARPQELLGLEPGRALALGTAEPEVDLSWQLQSLPWAHGCGDRPCGKNAGGWCPQRVVDAPTDYELRAVQNAWHLVRPKTARSKRALPIPTSTAAALAAYLAARPATDLPVLFVNDAGRVWLDSGDLAAWRAVCTGAGIEREVDRYIGRHTSASLMAALGVDPETQKDLMGHTSITTTNGYKHRSRAQLRKAVADLEDALTAPDDVTMLAEAG